MLVIEKVGILHVVVKDATKVEVLSKGEFLINSSRNPTGL